MKKNVFILFLWLLLFNSIVQAQDTIGMAGYGPIGYKDTVQAGATDTFRVEVKNYGLSTFNDTITIVSAVRDIYNASILHIVSSQPTDKAIPIAPSDSIEIPLIPYYDISSGKSYRAGINVIVIWPVAPGAITVDSLEYTVYVMSVNSVSELDLKELIKIFPNPTVDHFTIQNKSQIVIEEVRIYDTPGCLIEVIKNQSMINTKEWPAGIYMISVLLDNGQQHSLRIIKQK